MKKKMKMKKGFITEAAALVAGSIGATVVYNKATMISNEKLRAALPLAIGIVLLGNKSKMIAGLGAGMIAGGGQKLVGSFVPGLAGIDYDDTIDGIDYDDISGDEAALNGGDDVLNGFADDSDGSDGSDY